MLRGTTSGIDFLFAYSVLCLVAYGSWWFIGEAIRDAWGSGRERRVVKTLRKRNRGEALRVERRAAEARTEICERLTTEDWGVWPVARS